MLIVADNGSRTLSKISEIYDRVAFAAVGKYNEFQMLRVAGVRHADLKGYSYSREDVSAKELANAYAQTLGQVFTHEMKPYEVELLVAEVGRTGDDHAEMYHLFYDGVVIDERATRCSAARPSRSPKRSRSQFADGMELGDALKLGARVLGADGASLGAEQLEVALLERARPRRAFRRIKGDELTALLGSKYAGSVPAQHLRDRSGDQHEQDQARPRRARSRAGGTPRGGRSSSKRVVDLVDLGRRAAPCSPLRSDRRARTRRPAPVADRQAVRTVERAPQLDVEALVDEAGPRARARETIPGAK